MPVVLLSSRTSISEIWSLASRTPQIATRFSLAVDALRSFSSSPVWGIGVGVFPTLPKSNGLIIHSTYLWLLAETGVIGLLFLIYVLVRIYLQGRAIYRVGNPRSRWIALAGISSLGAWLGLMVGIEGLYQRHYWFLCAAIGAVYLAEKGERGHPEKAVQDPPSGSH
jgi:O-antigen ligase